MGNKVACQGFDRSEIKRLSKRFRKLDLDKNGAISIDEFLSMPELAENPIASRVVSLFDTNNNGEVDFAEFIAGISVFSVKGSKDDKLKFAFKFYDLNNDGFITNAELFKGLKTMVGMMRDEELQQVVDKTIIMADTNGDGQISYDEFAAMVGSLSFHRRMIVTV